MPSIQSYLLKVFLQRQFKGHHLESISVRERREQLEALTAGFRLPKGAKVKIASAHGIPVEQLEVPESDEGQILFFLHGGGYTAGSFQTHRALIARLAVSTGAMAVVPDYRLAPEYPFPAAIDDAVTAFNWCRKSFPKARIILAGDEAGAGLALSLMLKLRDEGLAMPDAGLFLCPWFQLDSDIGNIWEGQKDENLIVSQKLLQKCAHQYGGKNALNNPYISPLGAESFKGLPEIMVQASGSDFLVEDALAFARRAEEDGVEVNLRIWDNMPHLWQLFGDRLPEARKAHKEVADFLDSAVIGA